MSKSGYGKWWERLCSPEFLLVLMLVVALLAAMLMIFIYTGDDDTKDLLAIIFGAFGAWIGAGAAYFFGRENLRSATDSMLKMRADSPQQRLVQTTLRSLGPRSLPRTFTEKDQIDTVLSWLEEDAERFFAVILDSQGRVANIIDEEAVYRYIKAESATSKIPYDEIKLRELKKVVEYIEGEVESQKKQGKRDAAKALDILINIAIQMEEGKTASAANEVMNLEKKHVTIVVDDRERPVGYITTTDIRRLALTSSMET